MRIAIPDMLLRHRADAVKAGKVNPVEKAAITGYTMTMTHPAIYDTAGKVGRFFSRILARKGRFRRLPPPLHLWTKERDFPALPPKSFRELWAERKKQRQSSS